MLGDYVVFERGAEDLVYNDGDHAILREVDLYCVLENFNKEDLSILYRNNIKSISGQKIR